MRATVNLDPEAQLSAGCVTALHKVAGALPDDWSLNVTPADFLMSDVEQVRIRVDGPGFTVSHRFSADCHPDEITEFVTAAACARGYAMRTGGEQMRTTIVELPIGGAFEVRELQAPDQTTPGRYHVKAAGGFEATAELDSRELVSAPAGTRPLGREWEGQEVMRGVAQAVHLAMVSPPEKKAGVPFSVDVVAYHLYEANGKL